MKQQISPDFDGDYRRDGDSEQVPNPERGCGYLKAGNAYVRADVSVLGILPRFVLFTDEEGDLWPIPYKESMPRGYMYVNGTEWLLAAQDIREITPMSEDGVPRSRHAAALGKYETIEDVPESELQRHIDRVVDDGVPEDQTHWGVQDAAQSKDLLMRAGESHYPDPWDFIDEAYKFGMNKGINVSENHRPPHINSGRTRCFIIHPNACGDGQPGIVGFSYLTRTIFTKDTDGDVPAYAEDDAAAGNLDIVEIDEPEPREDDIAAEHASLWDYEDDPGDHEPVESEPVGQNASDSSVSDDADDGPDSPDEATDADSGPASGSESDVPDVPDREGELGGIPGDVPRDDEDDPTYRCPDCMGVVARHDDGYHFCLDCKKVVDVDSGSLVGCNRDGCDGHAMRYVDRPGIKFRCASDGQGIAQDYVFSQVGE